MINRLSTLHAGTQPIRVLQYNITYHFETTNPEFIELTKQTIARQGLQAGMAYHINDFPIDYVVDGHKQTPFVDANKKIHIHETFLSYVWCGAYSLFVLYDEAVAKPSQNQFAGKKIKEIDGALIDQTQELFNYAISLIKVFSSWDKTYFPNPEIYEDKNEFFIERANGVFVHAVNFILCHEFAHVEKEHFEQHKNLLNTNGHILQFEKEADKRAIELVMRGATDETRVTVNLGILVGLCCLLFFRRETTGGETHPDTDDRINGFLTELNLDPSDRMWGIAALAFKLWDNQFSKNFHWPKHVQDFKELYEYIREQVKTEKP